MLALAVKFEFDHGNAVPAQSSKEPFSIGQETWRWLDRSTIGACSTRERKFVQALMAKMPAFLATRKKEFCAHATSEDIGLLKHRRKAQPLLELLASLRLVGYDGHGQRAKLSVNDDLAADWLQDHGEGSRPIHVVERRDQD